MPLIKAMKNLESGASTSKVRRLGFVGTSPPGRATPTGHRKWAPQTAPSHTPASNLSRPVFARRTRAAHACICTPGSPAPVGFLDHLDLAQEMMTAGDPVAVLDAHTRARSELRLAATGSTNMRCLAAAGDHTPASNAPPRRPRLLIRQSKFVYRMPS
jgi:hypothetical protein